MLYKVTMYVLIQCLYLYVAFLILSLSYYHTKPLSSCRFITSSCPGTGGGIFFNYGQTSDPSFHNTFTAYDMEFVDNAAGYGGGIFMLYGG